MQGQANVKSQQNFELAGVKCKKCLNNTMTKTFQYEFPVLAILFQKLPTKSSSLCLLRNVGSQAFMPRSYEKDFYYMAL